MSLEITIKDIPTSFTAYSFYYKRRLGEPNEYGITLILNQANQNRLGSISDQLSKEKTLVSLSWQGEEIIKELELTQCIYLENAAEPRLLLLCTCNKYQTYQPGAFYPRKRILKAGNLLELFRKYFSSLVELDNTIEHAFEKIKFPDKEKTNLVQYLKTDHEMLNMVINWYNYHVPAKDVIVVSGTSKSDRFVLKWIQNDKCKDLNYKEERKLDDKIESDLTPALRIGFQKMVPPPLYKNTRDAQSITYIINRGNFNTKEWNEWKMIELASFYKNRFAYHIYDRFIDTRDGHLGWESRIATLPKTELLNIDSQDTIPWAGSGKVVTRSATDFWMQVELNDFEKEKEGNKADVRITSIYSGHKGNAGLHLIPEKNTEVQIFKGSDWLSPIMLVNNIRSEKVVEQAPYWKLEDTVKWDFQSTEVKVKDITTKAEETVTVKTKGVTTKIDHSKMEIS